MSSPASDIARMREGRSSVRAAVARLRHYVLRNRGYYTVWALLTLCYSGAFLGAPILSGRTVDAIEAWYRGDAGIERVTHLALLLAAVGVAGGLLRYFSRVLVFNAARQIEYEIRNDLYAHLQRLPQSFYFRQRTGDLMSRCVNDLNSVRLLLGPGLLSMLQTPILLIGALSVMVWMDWQLALLAFAPYPLFILIARTFGRGVHHWSIMVQEGLGDLSNQLQEAISGISVVKTYAMEPVMEKRFEAANQELFHRHLRLVRINGLMPAITGLLPSLGLLLVFAAGGSKGISKGEFFTFAMLIYQLTFPTFIMGWVVALIQRGSAAMQRIDEILATEPSIADRSDMADVASIRGEIEFRDLDFHYPGAGREAALREVSLRVPAGSTLGIVGPVGAGKTTLASVIPRLFEVDDGQVFIDGVDVNRIPLSVLRKSIAMVPQDSFLFSMTLAENVAYGLAEVDAERVAEAVERAQLTRDLAELPRGLATVVGERGVMLSGGQRQRTALARALALDPRILILDDTLSSVDAATEEAIQESLSEVFGGRTVVIISHRVSSVRDCDRIVVLEDGAVTEQGTHKELLLHGGFYARLARQQALEQELEEDVA